MFLLLIMITIACLLIWIVLKWMKIANYWAELNVPFLSPHPILGSLTFIQQENTNIWMKRMYNHFKAPYYGIWLFWRPALIVNSPKIARNILVKDSAVFRDRFINSGETDPLGSLNFFTVNDPVWTNIRKKVTNIFSSAKLKSLQGFFQAKSEELIQRIDKGKNGRINLRVMFADYTTDIIGTYAFGLAGNATTTGESPLRNVTKELMKFSIFRGLSWCSIFFFPELVDIFKFKFFPTAAADYFRRIFRQITSDREASNKKVGDFLDILMKIQKEDINGEFPEDFFIGQAAILLLGGFDTTAVLLTFITYELAHNPDIQERLYQELLEAQETYGEQNLGYEALGEAVYLNCVIKESLRKYPAMGWLDRVAAEDYKIDENLTIKAGTPVYINVMGMQHDANYFPDPYTLDPDRFLPENEKNIIPYTYLPFGEGPRVCLGQRFAIINVRNALSTLLLNYEIQRYDDGPNVSDIKIEKRGLFLMPSEDLFVKFIPRSK